MPLLREFAPNWVLERAATRPEFAHQAAATSAVAGSREGAAEPSSRARQHAVSNSKTLRFCFRAVATTLSIHSTNRLSASLSVPPPVDPVLQLVQLDHGAIQRQPATQPEREAGSCPTILAEWTAAYSCRPEYRKPKTAGYGKSRSRWEKVENAGNRPFGLPPVFRLLGV